MQNIKLPEPLDWGGHLIEVTFTNLFYNCYFFTLNWPLNRVWPLNKPYISIYLKRSSLNWDLTALYILLKNFFFNISEIKWLPQIPWPTHKSNHGLIILDITKHESNNCFIVHRFEENMDKHSITWNTVWHCSWKSCIALPTYSLVTDQLGVN